jgi:glycosyltransferase involved in cell wall biosynthesis
MPKKKKLKILAHSNHSRAKTGFGKHMKHLLSYLHKTGKYEIIEVANGRPKMDPSMLTLPWKGFGSLPQDQNLIQQCQSDQQKARLASYGHYGIDDLVKENKPDIYLGIEDIWGVENFWKRTWWKNINSMIWTPVDSVPLLDKHIEGAKNTQNIIVQASFAQKALSDQGFKNVHLLPVPLDPSNFFKIDDSDREHLRSSHGISKDDFIIGFVFRNQLRKSVPNLLKGFKLFKEQNPNLNTKLLLHTHWGEGWDIPRLLNEEGIDPKLVLTTYFCDKCNQYEIKPFSGQNLDCKLCGSKKSQQTVQIQRGVFEDQLNQIYNLMDVYCHAFTSGGQEIPIQEAKLCELITLVTNYSCGEDYCSKESGGLPLDWAEYREPGTQFIKASTDSMHIANQLTKVYNMTNAEKNKMGKTARDFVIDFCSIESVCSKFEKIISKMSPTEWDFDFSYVQKDPSYLPPAIADDREWIIDLYKNILKVDAEANDQNGIAHWQHRLKTDLDRQGVYDYFVSVAKKDNRENNKISFEDLLDKEDEGKRILFVLPENATDVFNSTSLLKYIKDKYPDHNIYYATKPENADVLFGNPYVHKVLQYDNVMENFVWSEGYGDYKGFFNFTLMPHSNTSIATNYIHGNKHSIEYDLNYA